MTLDIRTRDGSTVYTAARNGNVLGYVAVNSTVAGRSCGGVRMMPDLTEDEVRALARAMTLKYGYLGLPQGGAKAGVVGDPEAPEGERRTILGEFAREIAPLLRARAFIPSTDMGTSNADIRFMLESAGVKVRRRELLGNSSGYYTAVSAVAGVAEAARRAGLALSRATAAVEGFGRVGREVAALLAGYGVKVVAVSTRCGGLYDGGGLDVERLLRIAGEAGERVVELYGQGRAIDKRLVTELPVDVLCPCARLHGIHSGNVARVSARIVCGGANDPIEPEAEKVLLGRGVLSPPDFVANCGGVLGGTMEFASLGREYITAFITRRMGAEIRRIHDEAERTGATPRAVAEGLALRRFEKVKQAAEHPGFSGRALSAGLALYRRGLVPSALVRAAAPGYFERLFDGA